MTAAESNTIKVEEAGSKIQIPETVKELLEPISTEQATGQDASMTEDYFKLEMEIGKGVPDYQACVQWATNLLKDQCKDIRIAVWLCYSWYRTEKIPGLRNGFILIAELLTGFGDGLFPQKPIQRSKSLLFLNSRLPKFLEREKPDPENAPKFVDLLALIQQIQGESEKQFPDHVPDLKTLGQALEVHETAAAKLVKKAEPDKQVAPETSQEPAPTEKAAPEKKEEPSPEPTPPAKETPRTPAPPPATPKMSASSENEALLALKRTLSCFFEIEKDGKKTRQIPDNSAVYGMSRMFLWGRLKVPPHKEKVTQIEGPNPTKQNYIVGLFTGHDWEKLIPEIEIKFLEEEGFKYWFDVQRYVTTALEQKGGSFSLAAEEVKLQLARLMSRNPGLQNLKFKDKQTSFADNDTKQWIEDEVLPTLGSGQGESEVLPPLMGEEYEALNEEYKSACAQLPENFEQNAETMQRASDGDPRRKGRFLRTLNLAHYCYQAKHHELAKVLIEQLYKKIECYQLSEWEPALCVAVWQAGYLINLKLMKQEESTPFLESIEREQTELFTKIGTYNCVLAKKLADRKPNQGD